MEGWKLFCREIDLPSPDINHLRGIAAGNTGKFEVYPDSIRSYEDACFFMARYRGQKVLVIYGDNKGAGGFTGSVTTVGDTAAKVCELNNENCAQLKKLFPFTNPSNHRGRNITIGLGDRLGLASPGHIKLIKDKPVFPILAQQSIRELNLTGRTYHDVLSAASWAVFQEGYTKGFGADGDHLKTAGEVKMALDCGFTMITLDCSEHIDNKAASLPPDKMEEKYMELDREEISKLEAEYTGRELKLKDGTVIEFGREEFKKAVLVYLKAIKYTIDIYNKIIKVCSRKIDFEMSIDETLTPTTPEAHYFVASELVKGGVEITSLAPRFCGEFQKGIDYIGDVGRFTREFGIHVRIAEHFGYKISVHSGSDKFSVFPIVGEKTHGKYHLKTAGTNWLEAVRVIARKKPDLYRRMHKFAVIHLNEARKYYHIGADPARIPDIDRLADSELPGLLDMVDSRQMLHITYGLILQAKNPDGSFTFRNETYETLGKYEDEYYAALRKHIGKHLEGLGIR